MKLCPVCGHIIETDTEPEGSGNAWSGWWTDSLGREHSVAGCCSHACLVAAIMQAVKRVDSKIKTCVIAGSPKC